MDRFKTLQTTRSRVRVPIYSGRIQGSLNGHMSSLRSITHPPRWGPPVSAPPSLLGAGPPTTPYQVRGGIPVLLVSEDHPDCVILEAPQNSSRFFRPQSLIGFEPN